MSEGTVLMRLRRLLPVSILIFVALGVAAWRLEVWPFQPSYHAIAPGTSRAEVYRMLGGPGWRPDCAVGVPPGENPEFWDRWDGTIRVDFDDSERVVRVQGPR